MNSEFEGLNLPQLLDLMHEIVLPEPVSWIPQTQGWWVLAAWMLIITLLCVARILKRRRHNLYRREALSMLDTISAAPGDNSAAEIAALVKRTALAAFPRGDVASLYGSDWAEFLVRTARNDKQVREAAPLIAQAAYRDDIDASLLVKPARRWIRLHHA